MGSGNDETLRTILALLGQLAGTDRPDTANNRQPTADEVAADVSTGPEARLVSMKDAGRMLGIGRSQVDQLAAHREIEKVKIGRRALVTVASIDAYVQRLRDQIEA
jgi:predicted DNA-binding transcriptional regulator AlpA